MKLLSRASSCLSLAAALTLSTSACNSAKSSDSNVSIYGGQKSTNGAWPSAVAISGPQGFFCSGTAITTRLVVTAAHCLDDQNPSELSVYVGEGQAGGMFSGQARVIRGEQSPDYGYSLYSGFNDVAYLLLDKDLPLAASDIIPMLTDKDEMKEVFRPGYPTTLVGYGITEASSFGVKFETTSIIYSVHGTEATLGGNGKDACQGDSGGPAYAQLSNGEWRVFGVVSRGPDCGSGGQWGLMHSHACWIEQSSGVELGDLDCDALHAPVKTETKEDENFDYSDAYGGGYCAYFGGCFE